MRERQSWMVVTLLLVWTTLYLVALRSARGQTAPRPANMPSILVTARD